MRANNSGKFTITIKFLAALSIIICLVIGLGILRFHAARLAYYLESVNQSIRQYSDEEVVLRQELSALIAPIRIYSYCKENLGMHKVLKAETIPVRLLHGENYATSRRAASKNQGWRSTLAWLFGK